jgi:hypothetical protein
MSNTLGTLTETEYKKAEAVIKRENGYINYRMPIMTDGDSEDNIRFEFYERLSSHIEFMLCMKGKNRRPYDSEIPKDWGDRIIKRVGNLCKEKTKADKDLLFWLRMWQGNLGPSSMKDFKAYIRKNPELSRVFTPNFPLLDRLLTSK